MKAIKKLINVEKKFANNTITTAGSTTATIAHLSTVAQGDTQLTRDGLSIKPQYLQVRALLTAHSSAGNSTFRFMVVRDNQQVADTNPTVLQVLEAQSPQSMRSMEDIGRFNILYDLVWNTGNNGGESLHKVIIQNLPLSGHIRYNGSAATDVQKGGIFLIYFGNQAANTTTVACETRLVFTDN